MKLFRAPSLVSSLIMLLLSLLPCIAQVTSTTTSTPAITSTNADITASLAVEPIPNPTATDAFLKSSVSDKFDVLRLYRNSLVYAVVNLTTKIQLANDKLKQLKQSKETLEESRPRFRYGSTSKTELQSEQSRLNNEIQSLSEQLQDRQKYHLSDVQVSKNDGATEQ
jgi:hypothetical protein